MSRRSAIDQAAREARVAAIRGCRRCGPNGWRLGIDRMPVEPAVRCTHSSPPAGRDITAPIHQPEDNQ